MKKLVLSLVLVASASLVACGETKKETTEETTVEQTVETTETPAGQVVETTTTEETTVETTTEEVVVDENEASKGN
ncbi:hypothetical protein AB4865_01230 [Capnocytophaga sp. ARDL2]|uniref:hypothetical protein n=1 Tax=Capnocytophaga sp. ARDL2 TaxID=3238809 RepID=UPI0035578133